MFAPSASASRTVTSTGSAWVDAGTTSEEAAASRLERQLDDLPRLDATDRIDDDARAVGERGDEVLGLELADAANPRVCATRPRQPVGDREPGTVVASGRVAADEDRPMRRHDAASTVRSRKWAAHEMHGS